jgi:hypothetical protein
MRLFACACCRRVWPFITDPRSRAAVEATETFVDGLLAEEEFRAASSSARAAYAEIGEVADSHGFSETTENSAFNACYCAMTAAWHSRVDLTPDRTLAGEIRDMIGNVICAPPEDEDGTYEEVRAAFSLLEKRERECLSVMFREIFGNPFRQVVIAPNWLAANDGAVPKLAQGIYEERAFDRMPILADALEDAGCTDSYVLRHCRGPGPHVRGCWVVDLLLAKS